MNEQDSEPKYEIVPPPLPSENTSEHQYVTRKMRWQILNLCGQSVLVSGLLVYLKHQFEELSIYYQGHIDPITMVRIVLEHNKVLICFQG